MRTPSIRAPLGIVNRIVNWIHSPGKPRILRRLCMLFLSVELPVLRHPVRMMHPYNITVNANAKIGRNVEIYQGVTIGDKRGGSRSGVPTIEDDVCIYPNAVIVGGITVAKGAVIGPGAVVFNDVPTNVVMVGNPAQPLKE